MTTHAKTVIFVVGALLGIVIGEMSVYGSEVGVLAVVLGVIQLGLYGWERKRKMMKDIFDILHHFPFPLVTSLFCLGLFIGIIRVQLVEEKNNFVCESSCTFNAVIVTSPETKNEYQIFSVEPIVKDVEALAVEVRTPLYPKYEIGETLKLSGKVTVPKIIYSHNEIKEKGFDYASYLLTKNIGSEMMYPRVEGIDSEAHAIRDVLGRLKENLTTRIDTYVSSPASSLASGMLFGASSMSKELTQTFRSAGLSHIVVLSGFNIVIVIASILFALAFLPLTLRIVFASISVVLFVIMVGGSPSVIRATLMAFIALLAMLVGRQYVAKQALIISLFIIVMYEPYALMHDVSLHLSFLATVGLVYMSEPLTLLFQKYFSYVSPLSLRELFITTLSAYFATLPYVMYTFGTVSVYALIANVLVVPFVPIAMLFSFLVVFFSYISHTLSLLIGYIDSVLIGVMIWVARTIELFPYSTVMLNVSFKTMCFIYLFVSILMILILRKYNNETRATRENGNLTDIISY